MNGDQGCIDVVKVDLAAGLELVEEIQKAKCEGGAWLFQRCRKPPHTKELNTRCLLFSRFPTVAVVDANGCSARNVEEGEIYSGRRSCTAFADAMTQLVHCAEIQ
jgi:hypothetical protein